MSDDALSRRLRFWLWWMAWCEAYGLGNSPFYFWCVRRASACNRWRRP